MTRAGKRAWRSIAAPCSATGAASTSATTCTACGLPIDTAVIATVSSPTSSGCTTASESDTKGTFTGASSGTPMSTVTRPSARSRGAMIPDRVSTRISALSVSPLSCTKRTKQRAPLPHCSTSPPSALKMR